MDQEIAVQAGIPDHVELALSCTDGGQEGRRRRPDRSPSRWSHASHGPIEHPKQLTANYLNMILRGVKMQEYHYVSVVGDEPWFER